MRYPNLKIGGKKVVINKKMFNWYKKVLKASLTFDNQVNELGLTIKAIEMLSWNGAVAIYRGDIMDNPM